MPVGVAKAGKRVCSPRVARVTITCEVCGLSRSFCPSQAAQRSGRFCSKGCATSARNSSRSSKLNLVCAGCGTGHQKWSSEISESGQSYCSKECFHASNPSTFSYADWAQKNRDRVNEQSRKWARKNRSKRQAIQAVRRSADKTGASVSDCVAILALAEGQCTYCGEKADRLQLDHVIPIASGGTSQLQNLIPACKLCNVSKGKKPLDAWLADKHGPSAAARVEQYKLKRAILAAQGVEIIET